MLSEVSKQTMGQRSLFERIAEFANSDIFDRMFREGMDLVEETAAYLDGDGRQEAKFLERDAALAYASESMRLTTRLMQAASWLLVHRAVREGEITPRDANDPKYRLGAKSVCRSIREPHPALPTRLLTLLERSHRIYDRVDRIEGTLFDGGEQFIDNPVNSQLLRLQAALSASD